MVRNFLFRRKFRFNGIGCGNRNNDQIIKVKTSCACLLFLSPVDTKMKFFPTGLLKEWSHRAEISREFNICSNKSVVPVFLIPIRFTQIK